MSLTTAFNVALSGLTAAGRASGVVSGNIANAMTPGYARRTLELSGNVVGGGVTASGITRHADPVLIANRRATDAEHGHAQALDAFHGGLESLIGSVDDPGSIVNRLADFESGLIAAASNPGSKSRLDGAVHDARALAASISGAAEGLRDLRSDADRRIGQMVTQLNTSLEQVERLNGKIRAVELSGSDSSTLVDQRQALVDGINTLIPIRIAQRGDGEIALYSEGGAILLDGRAVEIGFEPAAETRPHMSVDNGLLSGLEIAGRPVRTLGPQSVIRGGALAAQFEIRDTHTVEAQKDLDALARDLVERMQDPGVDPTRTPGDAGLFTDNGTAFSPANAAGLANRLEVHVAVDPLRGGDSWRLRDGLGAPVPGSPGDASLLNALGDALGRSRPQPTPRFGTGALDSAGVGAALLSRTAEAAGQTSRALSFAAASRTEMQRLEAQAGVDTDAELQALMRIEQAYAANARVLQVVEELTDTLMRLGT
ncbi:flagellar hook-associated protein 1 FlgK [Cribrihabitans marinus]|uniref:Flagellar hook-associated protein 1 n=1 Tax=Cribrihabitans marinus TaxID=1227549 RepID=A0A1H7DH65_9RHOB|nr:flagellar hook-associated protein FlgK [Cribrihabitans marinus]GGH39372.1 flagellar hook-associated protein [Cribrihabitans marinus]SEK01161.1 flagellar hook-associated protein 1 FlgK [Cribrihabitans marinus]